MVSSYKKHLLGMLQPNLFRRSMVSSLHQAASHPKKLVLIGIQGVQIVLARKGGLMPLENELYKDLTKKVSFLFSVHQSESFTPNGQSMKLA